MTQQHITYNNPAFIHPSALLYGKVIINEGASVWPNVVIRSEAYEVEIGEKSNIQDFVMIHVGYKSGTKIGRFSTIAHHCTLHGCKIGDYCLIGINSTIMDDCMIGNNCVVLGHTFLKQGTVIPDNSVVAGVPGKVIKTLNNYKSNEFNALLYYMNAIEYSKGNYRAWSDLKAIETFNNKELHSYSQ